MENIYVQFDGMVYQQIVGIPMGTKCAPLIADLFLYCYERDFMSDLQKSKRFDLIDMFNDTSRYLEDIFTIDNPEFEKHISDIYPAELQLNKANTSDKETSFLDLNKKLLVVTFIPAFTTNAMPSDLTICTNIYFTENVRRGCPRRHMPEAADADNEIKKHCWCAWHWWTKYKEKEEEHEKYCMKYRWQKY